ncbi:MAG: tetratricopeptide repeat protein [Phycisphaerales bacterium JB054]
MHHRHVRYLRTLGLLLAAGLVPAASAQNAVGNGRALENRLQVVHPGAPAGITNSFSRELIFREAIVTGNAPGGFSFRGETLPSAFEFRGELGEDALFAYRRDSLYSGLSNRGIRGTEALQYQFALSVGGQIPRSLAGPISFGRAGTVERGPDPTRPFERDLNQQNQGIHHVDPTDEELMMDAVDLSSPLVQPVRSISSFTANRGLQPTLVGIMQNRQTQQTSGQTASPLLGVQIVPVDTLRNPDPFRANTANTNRVNAGNANPASANTGLVAPTQGQPAPMTTDGTGPQARTAYDDMMDRFRSASGVADLNAAPPAGTTPDWARDLIDLRRTLRGLPSSTAEAMGLTPEAAPEPNDIASAAGRRADPLLKPATDPDAVPTFDAEVLRRVREAGGMADTLIATNIPSLDMYHAHMQSGEQLLAQKRYFDAEERFISAMSSRPGDVNAQIGRTHAQIGAGLYLSAALNVRQLLLNNPEISGMRFAPKLLPEQARLDEIIPTLREGLTSLTSGSDSGLLLAYLGHQLERPEEIRAGLAALREHGDEAEQRLADLLQGVWLDAAAPTGDDSPADDG